uniref:Tripartite motif-containing protein 16-like n=1 Tax=Erpetoichthys calabaricus TaxID=27687 RepID=A0A8C4RDG9_ERPCA
MTEEHISESQDLLTCLVCLDTLKDPVTTPCGHNYCMDCITGCWDQTEEYSCPQCRETFTPRPILCRNTVLSEVVQKLKFRIPPPMPQNYIGPGDVGCDVCIGRKFRAVKSCLTCLVSFCETHIQPHYEGAAWKTHKLVGPTGNLLQKLCPKHQRGLEVFCKTDQTCICLLCVATGHRSHETVELEVERAEKQILAEIRGRIQETQKNLEEAKQNVKLVKISAEREVKEVEKSLADLIHSIEETRRRLTGLIRDQEKSEVKKADGLVEQLHKQMEELKRKDEELSELSKAEDHIHFLQTFPSFCIPPGDGNSLIIDVSTDFSSEDLRKELTCLKVRLEEISQKEFDKISHTGGVTTYCDAPHPIQKIPEPSSRDDFLHYSCRLTLDPNTAHTHLSLCEGNRKVTWMEELRPCLDHPDRFDFWHQVLCAESLSGTRCYWEVEWRGGAWIGVTYKGIYRKGRDLVCLIGWNDKSWSLLCSGSSYIVWHNNKKTKISAPRCPRIGVYLDYSAGSLSFYTVSHTMSLLHRFKASFTEPLYPGFGLHPYLDSSVTICPISQGIQ